MTRNLKVLGLALLTVCALSAVGTEGALAAVEHEFHSDGERTVFTGEQEGVTKIIIGAIGTVECNKAEFQATMKGSIVNATTYKSDKLTVTPVYKECTFGGQPATVFFNHCALHYDSDTTLGNPTEGEHANVDFECSEGGKVEIHTASCTATIGPQTVKHAVRYENKTADSITFSTTAHGIEVGRVRSTASQPLNGCLLFPTGAVVTITGSSTYGCFQDEGSELTGTEKTTPVTSDGDTTDCRIS